MSSLELGHYIGDFQRNYAGFIIFSREKKAIFPFKKVIFRESWVRRRNKLKKQRKNEGTDFISKNWEYFFHLGPH